MIYLDNAATTFPKPDQVYEANDYSLRTLSFNSGRGSYSCSNKAGIAINDFRETIATYLNIFSSQITILSSATEALNLIILGLNLNDGDNVYLSPFEHNAVIRPLYNLKKIIDFNIITLPFDETTWEPDIEQIENLFAFKKPKCCFVSQVSNTVGLMINYQDIFKISKKYNSINILDSSQCFGVIKPILDYIDFIVYAGHKSMYGVFGVGGFISLTDYKLNIIKSGGNGSDTLNHNMPNEGYERYESGSPNAPSIYTTNCGLKWILSKTDSFNKEKELTDYAIKELKKVPGIKLYLPEDISKIFGVISFTMENYSVEDVASILSDEFDICIRSGYHCAPFIHNFIKSTNKGGTDRISLSVFNKYSDIDALVKALQSL